MFLFSRDFLRSVCIFDGNSVFMFLDYVSLFVMCNMRLFVDAKIKLETVIRRMKSACAQYIKPKRRASLFWLPIATT